MSNSVTEPSARRGQQKDWVKRVLHVAVPVAGGAGGPASGIVDKRRFLLTRWQELQSEIEAELDTLADAIAQDVPFEEPDAIRDGVQRALTPLLDRLRDDINAAVDVSINAGDGRYAAVGKAVADCRTACASNGMLAALRGNTLTDGKKFEGVILDALGEVERKLTKA